MPTKSEEDWKEIAKQFYLRTNFPNCIGAIDGKHIRIQKPNHSGSLFYNYKNYFSIVLLAVVDADYCFTAIDVGSYGSNSDSNILKNSALGAKLIDGKLNIPQAQTLPNDENGKPMPFVIVGDEAFATSRNIVRPYPRKNLSMKQRVYNYRMCRARRMVECTFGILANKWRIFHRPLNVQTNLADDIIKSSCVLNNFVRRKDGIRVEDECYECPLVCIQQVGVRGTSSGIEARDYLADYFISPQGSLPWQYDHV
ncbi:protein ALP1-like [Homalodisca vitripennis]|nr:protein ALP1-like [Homalodisca vitripennis]XP_046687156.1 protein ALP1-like [Homalodisca vitripennis]